MGWLDQIATHGVALLGGGGMVGLAWAWVKWYTSKRTADAAAQGFLVDQLRRSLQYEYDRKVEAQGALDAARESVGQLRDSFADVKAKLIQQAAENIRLKGELLSQQKKGA